MAPIPSARQLLALVVLLAAAPAAAQPIWRASWSGTSVSLDVSKGVGGMSILTPTLGGGAEGEIRPGWVNSAQILSGRIPLGSRLAAVVELPFAVYDYDYSGADSQLPPGLESGSLVESHVGFGNPYLGIDARVAAGLELGGGVRLPLSRNPTDRRSNDAAFSGVVAHLEQSEAYFVDTATLAFHARYERPIGTTPFSVRVQASPALLYNVTGEDQRVGGNRDRAEGTLAYGVQAFAAVGPARIGGGLTGRHYVLDPREVGELFFNTTALRFEASADGLPVQPGLSARIPLSGPDFSDAVVSLSLTVPVR